MEWLWSERLLISPVIPKVGRGGGEFQMTGVLIRFSNSCKNDKRNSNLFFNKKQCKNDKRNWNPFFKVTWKWKTKVKRNSYPFFKVMRKRKTKSKIQICFSMSCENEKCKWHLNSIFPCYRKTVGTKVHVFWPTLRADFNGQLRTRGVLGLSDLFLHLHFSSYRTRPHAITAHYSSGISLLS